MTEDTNPRVEWAELHEMNREGLDQKWEEWFGQGPLVDRINRLAEKHGSAVHIEETRKLSSFVNNEGKTVLLATVSQLLITITLPVNAEGECDEELRRMCLAEGWTFVYHRHDDATPCHWCFLKKHG